MLTVVGGGGVALLGGSGLLGNAVLVAHVGIETSFGFGLFSKSLGGLLVDTEAFLDGVVAVIEVASSSHHIDLLRPSVRGSKSIRPQIAHLAAI